MMKLQKSENFWIMHDCSRVRVQTARIVLWFANAVMDVHCTHH